jgi:hypothetical protein
VEELRSTKGISLADHYRELMKWGSLVWRLYLNMNSRKQWFLKSLFSLP